MNYTVVIALGAAAVLAAITAPKVTNMLTTRGIRNNNPGNIMWSPANDWVGQVGHDGGDYAVFDSPEHGIRAMAVLLRNYAQRHGLRTITGIISTWAPEAGGNDTAAYIADVAQRMGVDPNAQLDINAVMPQLIQAIIWHENGQQPYTVATIDTGVRMAA